MERTLTILVHQHCHTASELSLMIKSIPPQQSRGQTSLFSCAELLRGVKSDPIVTFDLIKRAVYQLCIFVKYNTITLPYRIKRAIFDPAAETSAKSCTIKGGNLASIDGARSYAFTSECAPFKLDVVA